MKKIKLVKSLYEHFNDIIKLCNINLCLEEKSIISKKINKYGIDRLNKFLGGDIVDKEELNKCKYNVHQIILNNNKYNICVRRVIENKELEYYIINFYSKDMNCIILQINIEDRICHLTDLIKQQGCLMTKIGNNYNDNIESMGKILLEIVIKICEKLEIKEIQLLDSSHISCKNINNKYFSINLSKSTMLLEGDTWYGKFGFQPNNKEDKEIYFANKNNFTKCITNMISIDKIIKRIPNKNNFINEINEIKQKYLELYNKKLNIFMYWISRKYCEIYSYIYEYVYKKVGYKEYISNIFYLSL